MMSNSTKVVIAGLSYSDAIAFKDMATQLNDIPQYTITEADVDLRRLGEPVTLVLTITGGILVTRVVAAYLMRRRRITTMRYTVSITYPSGETRTESLILIERK